MGITKTQIEDIQIDYGIIYTNYGETDAKKLGPVRGGGEFSVDSAIRDIGFDESKGKTMGMQVVDSINALLKVTVLDSSIGTLALAMPYATLTGDGTTTPYSLTCGTESVGTVIDDSYLKNVTMFAKTVKGEYRKITLYNALVENKFDLKAQAKKEGEIALEFNAHWDATETITDLYKIETIASIT